MDPIESHVTRHIGPIKTVLHETISDQYQLDILVVAPRPERNYYTLVTSGMSQKAMAPPPEMASATHCELMICLPADWPMDHDKMKDKRFGWPIEWLSRMARRPHAETGWLWEGHTLQNGALARAFAKGTRMGCWIIARPRHMPQEFLYIDIGEGQRVFFFLAVPIHLEELLFSRENGAKELVERLRQGSAMPVIDPTRRPVCFPGSESSWEATYEPSSLVIPRKPTPGRVIKFVVLLPLHLLVLLVSFVLVRFKVRQLARPVLRPIDMQAKFNEDPGVMADHHEGLVRLGFAPAGDFLFEVEDGEQKKKNSETVVRFYCDEDRTTCASITKARTGHVVQCYFEFSSEFADRFEVNTSSADVPMWVDRQKRVIQQLPGIPMNEVLKAHKETVARVSRGRTPRQIPYDIASVVLDGIGRAIERKIAAGDWAYDPNRRYIRPTLLGALKETARQWAFVTLGINPLRRIPENRTNPGT